MDGVRERTDAAPRARRSWTGVLKHRWPTALGIAVAALAALDVADGTEFSTLVVLMGLVYVGAAALDHRRSAWVVLLVGLAVIVAVPLFIPGIDSSLVLLVAGLVFLTLGVARGLLRRPGGLPLQALGMIAFGSTALVALYVDPDLGGKLLAIALLGHAAWDAYHYIRNRVVARSYAEFCAVVDLLLGAAILYMT
jgi:hypothetical protein